MSADMEDDPLERLQNLQRDLLSFTESKLANVERLDQELVASMADFRNLLERKRRNQVSREALSAYPSGNPPTSKVLLGKDEYLINQEFREGAIQVADELDLDELEAAKLYQIVQEESEDLPETLPLRAILRFHRQRETLLDCIRIVFRRSADLDDMEDNAQDAQDLVQQVIAGPTGRPSERSAYWRKCIDGLSDLEASVKKTQDHIQTFIMTGRSLNTPEGEMLQAQRIFLTRQHEALASIITYLIRTNNVYPEDYRAILSKAASTETASDIMAHYTPILISGSTYFGSSPATTEESAKDLHRLFAAGPGQLQWKSKMFQSAATIWWLAEYSARFGEPTTMSAARDSPIAKLEEERSKLFLECCNGKAFHLMLAITDFLKPEVWYDPAKAGLVGFLLDNSFTFSHDATAPSRDFAQLTTFEIQQFIGAFVSNMPDLLRKLRNQEDDERRRMLSLPTETKRMDTMDLERFMLVVAGAYQEDTEAAEDFWSDKDGNLYGFLRWASQRLPTPRVAAFCQLLRSIANDEKSANQAHRFLLEDMTLVSGKLKKAYAVSWNQIFNELELYASSNKDKPATVGLASARDEMADPSIEETETFIMLEAYLRLATHVCHNSPDARRWILYDQNVRIHDHLLQLASSSVPPNVQASCFDLLAALLTNKTPDISDGVWIAVDSWIAGGGQAGSGMPKTQPSSGSRLPNEKQILKGIEANAEVATSFVHLLNALVEPPATNSDTTSGALPFPESLGSAHRHEGIELYVDFVLGSVLPMPLTQPVLNENRLLSNVLRHACLTFAWLCLSTFNEDLVVLANTTSLSVEGTIQTTSLSAYARLHPFARTMERLFNNNTILALFDCLHPAIEELEALHAASPVVQSTTRAIQVMDMALKLQPTYFGIVRPIVKTQATSRAEPVANPAIASFDEVMLSQLSAIGYLVHFTASHHVDLALESIGLLKKLSVSRKLTSIVDPMSGQKVGNRLIGRVQGEADAVALELRRDFDVDLWDLEQGMIQSSQPLKLVKANAVLDLLVDSLSASPQRPAIAHSFLGLLDQQGRIRTAEYDDDSVFATQRSLFHTIARCAVDLPTSFRDTNLSWLLSVKRGCVEVMAKLTAAPLTATLVLNELRKIDFLPAMATTLLETRAGGPWDEQLALAPNVLLEPSGAGIRDLMRVREAYFEYAGLELRAVANTRMDSVLSKHVHALLGSGVEASGERFQTASVMNLIDFFDIEVAAPLEASLRLLTDTDLSTCVMEGADAVVCFDLNMAAEILSVRKRELISNGTVQRNTPDEVQLEDEALAILASLRCQNQHRAIQRARLDAVEAWTDVVSTIITVGGLEEPVRTFIALQALQVALPRFERSLDNNIDAAGLFARLTLTLISAAASTSAKANAQVTSSREERLLAAFRVCLKAICDSETSLALRDVCYRTCCLILAATLPTPDAPEATTKTSPTQASSKQLLQQVQTAGERVVRVITEDAFSGRGVTRVSALLFLDAVLPLYATTKTTTSLIRSLTNLNFIPVLIDGTIGSVSSSFRGADKDLPTTLSYFHTATSLLLHISLTSPEGSNALLTAGLFQAIADSGLFSTDPDIGLDIDNPVALRQFYRLLSAVLRVVTAVVASRGAGNASVVQQAKNFLTQNRFCMQAVFKRTSRIDRTAGPPEPEAVEVAEAFAKVVFVCGWLEDDEPADRKMARRGAFT